MNGVWVDRVSLDDPHHRGQYRQDRLRVAWAMLADGLVGILSLGRLRSCWGVRASNDLVRRTLQARSRNPELAPTCPGNNDTEQWVAS